MNLKSDISSFSKGLSIPMEAFGILRGNLSLALYALLPLLVNLIVFGAGLYGMIVYRVELVELIWAFPADGIEYAWFWQGLWYVLGVGIFLLIFLVVFFLFTPIGCLVAAPFNDALAESTELLLDSSRPQAPFSVTRMLGELAMSLKSELQKLLFWLMIFIPALLLNLLPGIGSVLYFALVGTAGVFLMAYQFADYPLARKRLTFKQKQAYLNLDFAQAMGFGAGCSLLLLIPFLNLALIPICVVGGAMLFDRLRRLPGSEAILDARIGNNGVVQNESEE